MKRPTAWTHRRSRQRGYVLIIMLVVLVMGVLFTVAGQLSGASAKWGRAQGTANVLAQAKEALIGHAITYRETHPDEVHGYLPCPDMDGDGDADTCGSAGATVAGLLPYKTLELTDLRDKSGTCLWYVVSGSYKNNPKNNPKTAPMNWDTRGQIAVKSDSAGTTVFVTPADANGGAAAAIIAANAPLSGQSRSGASNTCGALPSEVAAYLDGSYALPNSGTLELIQGKTDSAENNDEILWITPREIWSRIDRRKDWGGDSPKKYTDINTLTAAIGAVLENSLISDLAATQTPVTLPPQSAAPYTTPTNAYTGKVGELPNLSASLSASLQNYLDNWKEQYHYAVCNDLCGYCLTVGGEQCNGALFFGGATASGAPRAAGARAIADLFEDGDGKPLLLATSASFGGASSYAGGSADTGICLASKADTLATALAHCVLPDATGTAGFTKKAGSSSAVNINPDNTITLGSSSGGASSGCVWTAGTYAFNNDLHVYFQVNIVDLVGFASGITFTIVDTDQNAENPPTYCGDSSYFLGYAGNTVNPIEPPKIGLEFDIRGSSPGRNDPPYQHMALVYWGTSGGYDDDNKHGTGGDSGYPANRPYTDKPYGVSDNLTTSLFASSKQPFHVRMDISRTNCGTTGTTTDTCDYTIDVWTLSDVGADSGDVSALSDVGTAYGGSLPQTVRDSFTMNRYFSGQEALKNVRLGFTSGQFGGVQEIVLSNLVAYLPP